MTTLTTRDLRPGDLMLQYSLGNTGGRFIHLGQWMRGQNNASIVHAGIMFDSTYIVEAVGAGLSAADIRVQNIKCGYRVYRARNPQLAQGAATCAKMMFDIQGQHSTLNYDLAGALSVLPKSLFGNGSARNAASMDSLLDDILTGRGHPFFCSQFVVYVFQFVAEQNGVSGGNIFRAHDAKVSPGALADGLPGNANFQLVGEMSPSQR